MTTEQRELMRKAASLLTAQSHLPALGTEERAAARVMAVALRAEANRDPASQLRDLPPIDTGVPMTEESAQTLARSTGRRIRARYVDGNGHFEVDP